MASETADTVGFGSERTEPSLHSLFCDPRLGGRQASYASGVVICEPDHPALDVFYIHEGQVRIHRPAEDGGSLLLEILGPGQWFGIAALAGRERCEVRAVTATPTVLTRVSARQVMLHVPMSPEGARRLIRELAERQCAAYEDAERLVFDDCNSRLIKTLLRFADSAAASRLDGPDGQGVVLRITHQQLAEAVGVARETVSLALTQLRKQNVLRTGRNQVMFDPSVLKQFRRSGSGQTVK
ncbi:MAG: Crp/Fnr family transcriptional regulator [Tepidisphaerales bacterium]